jgi:hypothetical protein
MAKVTLNPIATSMSRKIDDAVLRLCHTGELQFVSAPDMSRVKWSEAQKEHCEQFKDAVDYAIEAMKDPEIKAYYVEMAARHNSKRPVDWAVSDYYKGNDLLSGNRWRPKDFHAGEERKPDEVSSRQLPPADMQVAQDDFCI